MPADQQQPGLEIPAAEKLWGMDEPTSEGHPVKVFRQILENSGTNPVDIDGLGPNVITCLEYLPPADEQQAAQLDSDLLTGRVPAPRPVSVDLKNLRGAG